jgi:hypothetical protein
MLTSFVTLALLVAGMYPQVIYGYTFQPHVHLVSHRMVSFSLTDTHH